MADIQDPELFRDLCESATDLIQSVTPDGRFAYVNRAWLDTLGYSQDDVARLSVWDVIHPDSREHCEREMRKVMAGQNAVRLSAVFRSKNGESIHVQGSAACRFADGNPVATCGIFRNVSDLSRAEEDLDRLFTLSTDLLCVAGTDGYFKRINPAFEKVLGYTPEELLARPLIDFVHPDDRNDTLHELRNLARGRLVVDFENRYRAADGTWRWLAWRATPLRGRGEVYAVARDATENRRTRDLLVRQAADLERSNADLEQFAYMASHDLRSPLRAVIRLANMIEEGIKNGQMEDVHRRFDELRARVTRMETLTDDLLGYSRVDRDAHDVTAVDTKVLVEEIRFLLAPPEGFTITADASLPVLQTCRPPLEQVFRNLVANAVKHHDGPAGVVTVSAVAADDFYEFRVTDDGPGIPRKYHDRIWSMFQRLGTGDQATGHGIGLALVKKIVERYGGQVTLTSGEGRGSTFSFTWPRTMAT